MAASATEAAAGRLPAVAIYQLGDDAPRIAPSAWVAESASVIGRVSLAAGANVWFGCVLRGDNDWLEIGEGTNIQDGSVLHTDAGVSFKLGANVSVGHQVMLHGCHVGDGSLIGIQSVILNGARIGKNSIVGAGSLVTEGKEFPDGVLIIGSPAKVARELTPEQIARVHWIARHYEERAAMYRDRLVRIG